MVEGRRSLSSDQLKHIHALRPEESNVCPYSGGGGGRRRSPSQLSPGTEAAGAGGGQGLLGGRRRLPTLSGGVYDCRRRRQKRPPTAEEEEEQHRRSKAEQSETKKALLFSFKENLAPASERFLTLLGKVRRSSSSSNYYYHLHNHIQTKTAKRLSKSHFEAFTFRRTLKTERRQTETYRQPKISLLSPTTSRFLSHGFI